MKKSDLRPGMRVKHKISGSESEVRGLKDGSLGYADWCVGIRMRTKTGKNKGKFQYPIWDVENLEIIG